MLEEKGLEVAVVSREESGRTFIYCFLGRYFISNKTKTVAKEKTQKLRKNENPR